MREDRKLTALLASLALALAVGLIPTVAYAEISLAETYPQRNHATTVTVTSEGVPVEGVVVGVLYRPNSDTSHEETLPPTGADGTTTWTPDDAGLATLKVQPRGESEASLGTINVAVRFGGFPPPGIFIMALAGMLLFGGAGLGFVLLLQSEPPPGEAEPPST